MVKSAVVGVVEEWVVWLWWLLVVCHAAEVRHRCHEAVVVGVVVHSLQTVVAEMGTHERVRIVSSFHYIILRPSIKPVIPFLHRLIPSQMRNHH